LLKTQASSGIYNLGTRQARSFLDLAKSVFKAMNKKENIEFIDTPIDIRDKYQYFTQATMEKLRNLGYNKPFTSLEDGVYDYVTNYLLKNENY
jgi:ADP-L-glycero-D-manno-heptose 6-epimerase